MWVGWREVAFKAADGGRGSLRNRNFSSSGYPLTTFGLVAISLPAAQLSLSPNNETIHS